MFGSHWSIYGPSTGIDGQSMKVLQELYFFKMSTLYNQSSKVNKYHAKPISLTEELRPSCFSSLPRSPPVRQDLGPLAFPQHLFFPFPQTSLRFCWYGLLVYYFQLQNNIRVALGMFHFYVKKTYFTCMKEYFQVSIMNLRSLFCLTSCFIIAFNFEARVKFYLMKNLSQRCN